MNKLSCQRFVPALCRRFAAGRPRRSRRRRAAKLSFDGVLCERRLALGDIDPSMPSDWTGYTHLVMEMRSLHAAAVCAVGLHGRRSAADRNPAVRAECLAAGVRAASVFQRHGPIRH